MFRSHYDLFNGVALRDTDDVAPPAFANYRSNFSMVASMRHALLNAGVYLNHYIVAWVKVAEQSANLYFPTFPWLFLEKFACSRPISL